MLERPSALPSAPVARELPKSVPSQVKTPAEEVFVPRVEYPLAADPRAEFSEYIFEDVEILYPIFDYSPSKNPAVEIIILHKGRIFSVDYLPSKDGIYHLVGSKKSAKDIEFAYLGVKESVPFVEIKGSEIFVHALAGYKMKHIGGKKGEETQLINLGHEHIV